MPDNRKMVTLILLITIIFVADTLLGDDNQWTSNGPSEAKVRSIIIDPRNRQRIFVGTIENGLYLTTNGGEYWSHINDDTLDNTIFDLALHPGSPDTIYAATWNGMYRSSDAGISWSLLKPPGYWYSTYNDIEINPVHQDIILAGADLATGYRSTDGGNNWTQLDLPLMAVVALRTDPLRPDTVYLASQSGHYGLAVMRSEDMGLSWYSVHNDLDSGLVSTDLQIDPIDSDILYLAGGRYPFTTPGVCLEKSTDAGNHWFDITPDSLIEYKIWSLTISPVDHRHLYICTRANGILESTDGGNSWHDSNAGLTARDVFRMIIDPVGGSLYIGTAYHGILRSTDGGSSWEKISDNINQAECTDIAVNPWNPDTLYVATMGNVYRSINGTLSWDRLDLDYPFFFTESQGVEIDPYDPNYIYVSFFDHERIGRDGIFRSTDGGQSWQIFTSGLQAGGVYRRMAISDFHNGHRRIFLAGIGVYFSDDLGESWQLCRGLPSNYYYWRIEASPADPYLIYTTNGTQSELIYRSEDCGQSWISLSAPAGFRAVNTIACDPFDPSIVYICKGSDGAFKSTDAGGSWFDITNDLARDPDFFSVSGVAINPLNSQTIYISSNNRGVFVSHNGGQNWEDFNNGLDTAFYDAHIIVAVSDTNTLYLSTAPKSVWSYRMTETSVEDDDIILPDKFIALSSFPNPFNTTTVVNYNINKSGNIKLTIYDLLGRKVETLCDGIQQAGEHSVRWDASRYPSGVYFVRLKSKGANKSIKMVLLK